MTAADAAIADLDDTARAAVEAVEAAIAKLPPDSGLNYSVMEEGTGFGHFGGDQPPSNPGSKVGLDLGCCLNGINL